MSSRKLNRIMLLTLCLVLTVGGPLAAAAPVEDVSLAQVRSAVHGSIGSESPLSDIALDPADLTLSFGESAELSLSGDMSAVAQIFWYSGDEALLQMERDGYTRCVGANASDTRVTVSAMIVTWDRQTTTVTGTVTVRGNAQAPSDTLTPPSVSTDRVFLRDQICLYPGEIYTLTPTLPAGTQVVSLESGNSNVATVDRHGVVTAVAPGEAIVTVNVSGTPAQSSQMRVIVLAPYTPDADGLRVAGGHLLLFPGESLGVAYTLPAGYAGSLIWSSDNPQVVVVSDDGVITAIAQGGTLIHIKTADGAYENAVWVDVPGVELDVPGDAIELREGEQYLLTARVTPDLPGVTYTAAYDNPTAITVDGLTIIALRGGAGQRANVTVMAATKQGLVMRTVAVVVLPGNTTVMAGSGGGGGGSSSSGRGLSLNPASMTLRPGEQQLIRATLIPSGAKATCTFVSSNDRVATVTGDGLVTAIAPGTATIRATTASGGFVAECIVQVLEPEVASVTLMPQTLTMYVGELAVLQTSVTPKLDSATVTYKSSDTGVVQVYAFNNDQVTIQAKGAGTATITATADPGGKQATSTITVKVAVKSVTITNPPANGYGLYVGNEQTATASVLPADATVKDVVWESRQPSILQVNATTGRLIAISPGRAEIVARAVDDPSIYDVRIVYVYPNVTLSIAPHKTDLVIGGNPSGPMEAILTAQSGVVTQQMRSAVRWSSSNPEVATVHQTTGQLTLVGEGQTTITVWLEGFPSVNPATMVLNVRWAKLVGITVDSLPRYNISGQMYAGQTGRITASLHFEEDGTPNPAKLNAATITWPNAFPHFEFWESTSSLTNKLSPMVKATGNITYGAWESYTVTAQVDGVVQSASFSLSSVWDPIKRITVAPELSILNISDPQRLLTATVETEHADGINEGYEIGWPPSDGYFTFGPTIGSNKAQCYVKVTGTAVTKEKIYTAMETVSGKTATFRLASEYDGLASVRIEPSSVNLIIGGGDKPLEFIAQPINVGETVVVTGLTWRVDDNRIAEVYGTGTTVNVRGLTPGTTVVRAEAYVNGKLMSVTCLVTVNYADMKLVMVTTHDPIIAGVQYQMQAQASPTAAGGTIDPNATSQITWSSSNPYVYINPQTGVLVASKEAVGGSVTITARLGDLTATYTITQIKWATITGITVSPQTQNAYVGQNVQVTATLTVSPAGGIPDPAARVVWSSLNGDVVFGGEGLQVTGRVEQEKSGALNNCTASVSGTIISTPFTVTSQYDTVLSVALNPTAMFMKVGDERTVSVVLVTTEHGYAYDRTKLNFGVDNGNAILISPATGQLLATVKANTPGSSTLTASYASTPVGTCSIYIDAVNAKPTGLEIKNAPTVVYAGTQPGDTLWLNSDSGILNGVKWSSSNAGVLAINSGSGVLTSAGKPAIGLEQETVTITAEIDGERVTTDITVVYDTVETVTVTAINGGTSFVGVEAQYEANYTTAHGGLISPTNEVTWTTAGTAVQFIGGSSGKTVTVKPITGTPSSSMLTATVGGVSGSLQMVWQWDRIRSFTITPDSTTLSDTSRSTIFRITDIVMDNGGDVPNPLGTSWVVDERLSIVNSDGNTCTVTVNTDNVLFPLIGGTTLVGVVKATIPNAIQALTTASVQIVNARPRTLSLLLDDMESDAFGSLNITWEPSSPLTLSPGDTAQVSVTVTDAEGEATAATIEYSSSEPGVAVNAETGELFAVSVSEEPVRISASITVDEQTMVSDGPLVTVVMPEPEEDSDPIDAGEPANTGDEPTNEGEPTDGDGGPLTMEPVYSLSNRAIQLEIGETASVVVTMSGGLEGGDLIVDAGRIALSGDNPAVATAGGNQITAVGAGSCEMTVTVDGWSDTCTVTVVEATETPDGPEDEGTPIEGSNPPQTPGTNVTVEGDGAHGDGLLGMSDAMQQSDGANSQSVQVFSNVLSFGGRLTMPETNGAWVQPSTSMSDDLWPTISDGGGIWTTFPAQPMIAGTQPVQASVSLANARYSSQNPDVASVDANGRISPNGEGTTTITVEGALPDGTTTTDTRTISVVWDDVSGFTLSSASLALRVGDAYALTANWNAVNGGRVNPAISLRLVSRNAAVAAIRDGNEIVGVGMGSCSIEVIAYADGKAYASAVCAVNVDDATGSNTPSLNASAFPGQTQSTQMTSNTFPGSNTGGDGGTAGGGTASGGASSDAGGWVLPGQTTTGGTSGQNQNETPTTTQPPSGSGWIIPGTPSVPGQSGDDTAQEHSEQTESQWVLPRF